MLDSATPWTVGCQAYKRASKRAPRNVFSATWPPWLLAFSSPCYSTRAYKVSSQQTHFFFQDTSFSLLWAWTNTHTHTLVKSEKKKVVGIARILPVFLFRMVGFWMDGPLCEDILCFALGQLPLLHSLSWGHLQGSQPEETALGTKRCPLFYRFVLLWFCFPEMFNFHFLLCSHKRFLFENFASGASG